MLFFPENTTSCYTTHLQREIRLHGEWSVALAEIHVPCSIMHVDATDARYKFQTIAIDDPDSRVQSMESSFPFGIYESLEKLAEEMNEIAFVKSHQIIMPVKSQKGFYALHRECHCQANHYTYFSEKIRRIFGFENKEVQTTRRLETREDERFVIGNRPASLARAIPDQLYVYTDICAPYTVGDTQASLLRIVSLDTSTYRFGSNVTKSFAPRHYIPLLYHSFQNLVIDIRDSLGNPVSFEYGSLTVTLHFRRQR